MKNQPINHNAEFEEKLGYKVQEIMELFKHFSDARKPNENMWKVLDAFDRGHFWDIIKNKVPNYSIKPDTNWINFVKKAITDALYTGIYRGEVFPRSFEDAKIARSINKFMEYLWTKLNIPKFVLQAGDRASLLNFGALQFGWDADIIDRTDKFFNGDLEIKHIDNMSLFLDPSAINPYRGRAMFVAEEVPIIELMNEKRFRNRMTAYMDSLKDEAGIPTLSEQDYGKGYYGQRSRDSKDKTVRLLTCYYKYQPADSEGYRIDQIWLIDNGYILDVKTDIRPKTFPIRVLYSMPPTADSYGTPVTKLIMYNAMAINILDSIDTTHVYSSVKRPKVVSRKAGINERAFAKEGNNPDKLWIVDGDPNSLVRYIDVPQLPAERMALKQELKESIMRISGVDDKYTGRDTGSIQTTGAMDILSQRVSMSDNIRISMLQDFIREITELILMFYIEYGGERSFPVFKKNHQLDSIDSIDFNKLKEGNSQFDFVVNVTPHLPNNVMRRAEAANYIMEKQAQYNMQPAMITPEEWLEAQDFPQKYHILERMEAERMRNDREELMADMVNYAGMVNAGMRPEAAIDQLAQERQLKREQPGLGNTVSAGSIQARQM